MKTKSYFTVGALLLLVGVIAPMIYLRFGTNLKNPDAAEMESCCIAIPLVILSLLFILVGVTRLINNRSNKDRLSISPPE